MSRKPIDVYRALIEIEQDISVISKIDSIVSRYSEIVFGGQKISIHLTRFITLCSKLLSYLENRAEVSSFDITTSVDILDLMTSTSKWWIITRKDPSLVIRPPSHDPRQFIASLTTIHLDSNTLSRITGSVEKLSRFLKDQDIEQGEALTEFCESMVSTWILLTAFISKNQGKPSTSEEDFEQAFDMVRVLLFHVTLEDFRALTAIRRIATNTRIAQLAQVAFSPDFEQQLNSSLAARFEQEHIDQLTRIAPSIPRVSIAMLTNSLRILAQLQATLQGIDRIEKENYELFTIRAISMLQRVGISPETFANESTVQALFKGLNPSVDLDEKLRLLSRRFESLILDTTGNREFLLQYSKLVPRIISLLLLLAIGTKKRSDRITDLDIKRGLLLANELLSLV